MKMCEFCTTDEFGEYESQSQTALSAQTDKVRGFTETIDFDIAENGKSSISIYEQNGEHFTLIYFRKRFKYCPFCGKKLPGRK